MRYILDKEGPLGLFKGIGPQITKGFLVQGLLMMTKERYALSSTRYDTGADQLRMELIFLVLFMYLRRIRDEKLKKVVDSTAASTAKTSLPVTTK